MIENSSLKTQVTLRAGLLGLRIFYYNLNRSNFKFGELSVVSFRFLNKRKILKHLLNNKKIPVEVIIQYLFKPALVFEEIVF